MSCGRRMVNETSGLRRAGAADALAIAALDARVNASPWSADTVQQTLTRGTGFVCRASTGALLGFVLSVVASDECEILDIAVDPAHRRAGHARALLQSALAAAAADGAVRCFLEVRESNAPAQALYRSAGFAVIGRRRAYYRTLTGREDALLMCRDIVLGRESCRS